MAEEIPSSPHAVDWREFLARHADVLLCADLFTQEIWTFCGLKTAYVFFVIHLRTRTLLLAPATFSPHSHWLCSRLGTFSGNVMIAMFSLGSSCMTTTLASARDLTRY